MTQTFTQYSHLGHRLRKHYLSPRVFLYLISGQFVPPIHRKNLYSLQYSMLPAHRVSMEELWRLLTVDDGGDRRGHAGEVGGHVNGGLSPNVGSGKKLNGRSR